mgnify:CR=1 FL=1
MSPSSGANPAKISGPVGVCAALQSPKATSRASGAKSSAAPDAFAAAVAAVAFLAWTNAMLPEFNGLVFGLSVLVAVFWLAGLFSVLKVREGWAFIFSAATIATFVATLFYALYPRVMPSSLGSQFDLTITNASATENTLTVMSWVAVVMTPLVLIYQGWTYWVFRKRVSASQISNPEMGMLDTVHS